MLTTILGLGDYDVIIEALRRMSNDHEDPALRKHAERLMNAHRAVYKAARKDPAPGPKEISQRLAPEKANTCSG